jgi:ribosomal protein S18 acetylase RimI-like enzyme
MTEIQIQKASQEDVKTLVAIGKETFFEAFAESNTEADMKQYLEENFNEDKMRAELDDPGSGFYIAWEGENPIGYLKVNHGHAQTELQGENSLEIERIYVKSAYHGKKAGQLLYEKALEIARVQKKSFIWLGVWEENLKAIRFYVKNGFFAFDKHIFKMGKDEQTDIMMRKDL